jgi:Na+-driven multidrug efflux pump
MAVVAAGGSWFLGQYLGLGLMGIWIAYASDEWLRGLLMWRRWVTLGWVPHAREAHRRLRSQSALSMVDAELAVEDAEGAAT